ncbi:LysM peptidoglycan-binding domain-containing M23 family metallopeptidase [Streptomyces sp. GC420]|uniref:M23 family metallopeptidase n=1 Tax=Streptomyces sp. GC420 TaxID=2697568 RepID=UPI0014150B3E|nr:LysM peptidoglycan-binding domain-containing M23 family metallopeptidase [Streptomyces sp. GC420]NBM16899.1 peptidoglycan DD-metalloendopeptidase family protein [Streptomyces sp. GC420]
MPAKGKHRRPKNNRVTRGLAAAGTGGAALALPLIGATGASAAETEAPVTAGKTVAQAARAAEAQTVAATRQATAEKSATTRTYSVVAGDYLAKIADEQDVRGGWQKLYSDNREAIGENPSLIHPGLRLTIGAKTRSGGDSGTGSEASAPAAAPQKSRTAQEAQEPEKAGPAEKPASSGTTTTTTASAAGTGTSSGFAAPLAGATPTTPYRASGAMWSSGYHTGVDFAAATGTTVMAVSPGTVVSAGWGGAYGNQVVIRHNDGRYSQYAHLSSLSVSAGQSVTGGQQLGLSGSTGNSSGPHLHFEIRTGPGYGSDVDPLAYLRQNGVSI